METGVHCLNSTNVFSCLFIWSFLVSRVCPTCGSTLVFELDEAPLPTLGSSQAGPKQQNETTVVTASAPVAQSPSDLLHSPSDSSIGKYCSRKVSRFLLTKTKKRTNHIYFALIHVVHFCILVKQIFLKNAF